MTTTGIFETMRVMGGGIPLLDRHLERLSRSAVALRLPRPSAMLREVALERAADGGDRVLRLGWSGSGTAWAEREVGPDAARRVVTVTTRHRPYPHKIEERLVFDRAQAEAEAAGGDEALLLTGDGSVAETPRFAVCWLDGKRLCYPSADCGALPSIGLARLLEVATAAGLETRAVRAGWQALDGRPVWLVNAVRGVVPVASLDAVQVPVAAELTVLVAGFWPAA